MSLQSIMTLFSLISGLSMYALSLKYLEEKGEVEVVCLCHKIGYMLQAAILSGKNNGT